MRVGVIGVGIMGGAMATNLLKAGHEVIGFDVDPSKVEALAGVGLVAAASPAAVADSSEVVVLSLPSVPALDEVAATLAAHPREGLICLETGTLPLDAKEKARSVLAGAGIELMDVPLSGTGLQAADATLVVLASGSGTAFEKARPVLDAIGRSTHYLGEFGNGSKMKYIANLLVAVHNLATAEAHALGIAAGMDPALVQEVMEDGVGSSKIFEIRGPMMVADDYPPAARLDIIAKDAKLIAEFARLVGAPTPLLDTSIEYYEAASSSGLGDLDAAALCRFLEQSAGLAR
ncbi:MAG TPA: NAD(P)-dependent oxidoreductase [Acidimicrobiia bacterium]|nr:NAD(P)-dependent oxidoreductase [Acidimicrobiia bacterium]